MKAKRWRVAPQSLSGEGCREILDEKGNCIARLSAGGNGEHLHKNACLMAHATELLGALEYTLDLIYYCLERNPSWVGNLPEATAKDELAYARMIVVAAKGGASDTTGPCAKAPRGVC